MAHYFRDTSCCIIIRTIPNSLSFWLEKLAQHIKSIASPLTSCWTSAVRLSLHVFSRWNQSQLKSTTGTPEAKKAFTVVLIELSLIR